MFSQLQDEKNIAQIFLFSQLMSERGRSTYFREVLESKLETGVIKIDPDLSLSLKMFKEQEREYNLDISSDFLHQIIESKSVDSEDSFSNSKIYSRCSEKTPPMHHKSVSEFRDVHNSLTETKKKNKYLQKSLQEHSIMIEKLEDNNEMLKEVTFSLEKKIMLKEKEISELKKLLEYKEKIIEDLISKNEYINEEILEEKEFEIEQLRGLIVNLNSKIISLEKTLELHKISENNASSELLYQREKFRQEIKTLSDEIKNLSLLNESLTEKNKELNEKILVQQEDFESKKVEILKKFKVEKDELLTRYKLDSESNDLENSSEGTNELLELDFKSEKDDETNDLNRLSIEALSSKNSKNCSKQDLANFILKKKNNMMESSIQVEIESELVSVQINRGFRIKNLGTKDSEIQTSSINNDESCKTKGHKKDRFSFLFWKKNNPIVNQLFL